MKLTLHIGTEKTGSTSIQRALAADRAVLAERGILYPRLFGSGNHMEVAVASMPPGTSDELTLLELQRQNCDHSEYIDRLRNKISEEVESGNYQRLLISNEHCHSRLRDPAALRRLLTLLGCKPEEAQVVVYLRRQDQLAVSLHSTRLKLGGIGPIFPAAGASDHYFRFDLLLERYAEVFGRSQIKVRLYERSRLLDGDVVADFYEVAELGVQPSKKPTANTSLSATQMLFLERFNARFPLIDNGKLNAGRGPIYSAISNVKHKDRLRPPRAEAISFFERFKAGNDEVHHSFLPTLDRDALFDDDFTEYPEQVERTSLTVDEFMDFVEAIWRFKIGQDKRG